MTDPTIRVATTAVPVVDATPVDGQFVDDAGNPVPYVVPDGYASTTTTTVTKDTTNIIVVAAIGIQVGDYISLGSDLPRQVIQVVGGTHLTVAGAFGINSSGTTAVTRWKKVTPKLSWDLGGKPFGQLTYGKLAGQPSGPNYLQALLTVDSTCFYATATIAAALMVDGTRHAVKIVHFTGIPVIGQPGGPCIADAGEEFAALVAFATSGLSSGQECRVRAHAVAHYVSSCYRRGGTFSLGPRLGPIFTIP